MARTSSRAEVEPEETPTVRPIRSARPVMPLESSTSTVTASV